MTTKPQLGRNIYQDAIFRAKDSLKNVRGNLKRIVNESPGPQTLAMLITKIALEIGNAEEAVRELEEIGRNAKNQKGD